MSRDVSFFGITTLSDAVARIQQAFAGEAFEARVNIGAGTLQLIDRTHGSSGQLRVSAVGDAQGGGYDDGLGILGTVTIADSQGNLVLQGGTLHGDSLNRHIFLFDTWTQNSITKRATLKGQTRLDIATLDGNAVMGHSPVKSHQWFRLCSRRLLD